MEVFNSIPKAVEITLYMEPLKENEEPLEIKRIVNSDVGPLPEPSQHGHGQAERGTRGQPPGGIGANPVQPLTSPQY